MISRAGAIVFDSQHFSDLVKQLAFPHVTPPIFLLIVTNRLHKLPYQSGNGIGFSNIVRLTFSPDSGTLSSLAYNGTIRVWDVKTYKEMAAFLDHSSAVDSIAFSTDSKFLAAWTGSSRMLFAISQYHHYFRNGKKTKNFDNVYAASTFFLRYRLEGLYLRNLKKSDYEHIKEKKENELPPGFEYLNLLHPRPVQEAYIEWIMKNVY